MIKKYKLLLWLLAVITLGSCKKYLQVQPQGSYTEDQVYANPSAMQQALNGLYLDMADNILYGENLSTTVVEVMGQRYMMSASGNIYNSMTPYQTYQYVDATAQTTFDALWKKAYATILSTNVFLTKVNNTIGQRIITEGQGQQLKGEALGIRAMLHFDLLRLFGPVYANTPDQLSIPYYTVADGRLQPLLPASKVMDSVLSDLLAAEKLLASDPVTTAGVVLNADFYKGYRNQRMNYYAVKGLQARAYLWAGKKEDARKAAQAVLDQGEKWFPWMSPREIEESNTSPDRIFSPEVLFCLYNPTMYTSYTNRFAPTAYDGSLLTSEPNRLKEVFENIDNDYRYNKNTWNLTTLTRKTFFKYADVPVTTKPFRFLQPLLRKTEMYYILAETEPDQTKALGYLNTVRYNRNLVNLTAAASIPAEIMKEYKKEFWGEGQLFFYYKRQKLATIPSGINQYSTVAPVYVVPLPLSETTPR
jgi:hypothetical protein